MRRGPTTQSSLLQESESPKRDASQSALHYLSLEVSKLSSPVDHILMETDSVWLNSEEDKQSLLYSTSPIPKMKSVQSPLKLLNLINEQCEQLLNQSDDEEQRHCPLLITDFGNSNVALTCKAVAQRQDSTQPLKVETHSVVAENMETIQPEKRGHTVDAPQTSELKFNDALDLDGDWTKECLSTQYTFYDFLPQDHPSKEPSIDEILNGCLESAESCKSCSSCQQQPADDPVNTASTCEDSSEEIPKPSAENRLTHLLEKDSGVQCPTWRSKKRKQPCPSRSAFVQAPDFQGVTFWMDTELDDSKEKCRLLITSKYSTDLPKNVKRTRLRKRTSQKFLKTSSEEDSDSATSDTKSKVCASCSTSKTPMWRDAEDGTPLCNACGIRYKKYRVRCTNCWHIPKKDGNSVSRCSKCGHFVRLTLAQRRPTM